MLLHKQEQGSTFTKCFWGDHEHVKGNKCTISSVYRIVIQADGGRRRKLEWEGFRLTSHEPAENTQNPQKILFPN